MKAPAFQTYASDFYMDTNSWTIEEIGIYQRLLLTEWTNGGLPSDEERLSRVAGCKLKIFKKFWPIISQKFSQNGNGNLINKRMEEVRKNQAQYAEIQREKGKHGAEKRWKDHITHVIPQAMPVDSSSSSSSSLTTKKENIKRKKVLSDEEWKTEILKLNPWINWDDLNRDIDTWLLNNPHRQKTRRLITTFITRKIKDRPMQIKKPDYKSEGTIGMPDWIEKAAKDGWKI